MPMAAMVRASAKCHRLVLSRFPFVLLLVILISRATSLSFNYNFSAPGVLAGADLTYMNDSAAVLDLDRGRIDLTNLSRSWSTGRVAHRQPVRLWDDSTGKAASFTTDFTFAVRPLNVTASQGDGMAFFVGPYPASLPTDAAGGFLALFNNRGNPANAFFPPTVGVEFDTLRNVPWDPNDTINHLGINVNSISSTAYAALPDGSFNGAMSASVRYDAGAATLSATLRLSPDIDVPPEQRTYTVSANVDLRAAGLPQDAAVGFSAAIGELVEQHQILSWSFESTLTDDRFSKRKRTGLNLIAGLVSAGVIVLLAVAAGLGYLQYRKRNTQKASQDTDEIPLDDQDMDSEFEKGAGPRRFSYGELLRATRGFSDEEKLGEGGFGAVYRAHLHEQGLDAAIKRVSKTSSQGRREYVAEVTIIGRLRHRNLVQLLGWCHEADELLLVYELMPNGSLEDHLYDDAKTVLAWPARYRIILGLGSALLYLHQEMEQCVVHRDIKPSNVMLDASFNARLGDFGLARLVDHRRGARTTALAGTMGYMDPQCAVTSQAGAESDVYSFGVVLLEVACGRRPVVPQLEEEEDEGRVVLVRWVWELYGRGTGTLVVDAADARLDGDLDEREVERALVVGLWCVHPDYGFRPSIRQAMSVLQFEAPLPDLPPEMPVATYGFAAAPHRSTYGFAAAPHRSTYTSSSSTGCSGGTGGRSIKSDLTVEGRRRFVTADTIPFASTVHDEADDATHHNEKE